jgi:putative hydrolase of the HAD superfamily
MENKSIRNVVFDLGKVLLEWDVDAILETAFDSAETREKVREAVFMHPDWLELDKGEITRETAVSRFAKRTGLPESKIHRLITIVISSMKPIPASIELVTELLFNGFSLYCMSNMQIHIWEELRERYDFWSLFKGIVISAEINMIKPEPEIFQYLLKKYSLVPGETVVVDDVTANVEVARGLGMKGIVFTTADECRREISSL